MTLQGDVSRGAIGAALGILAIDCATYADMAITRRPPASLPADTARALARRFGVFERLDCAGAADSTHRWSALGALLGYVNGIASSIGYVLVRRAVPGPSWKVGAAALGVQTILAADGSAMLLGATDPRSWSASEWIRSVYPRAIFGVVVAGFVRSSESQS